MSSPATLLGRLLCWLGFHDLHVIDGSFGFGPRGVERAECRRCGKVIVRSM